MRQSHLFTKTRKEAPSGEESKNAEMLIRGGFIHKEMAGVYASLPLGLRVMRKIEQIVREELNTIGSQEVELTALQSPELWKKTNRWDDKVVDNWFKTKLSNGSELGLGFTHEEPLTNLMKDHVNSYRDLPQYVYQFQTKFRNELRAKSGVMRGREFLMKDLYSFSRTEEERAAFYEEVSDAYMKIFKRVGIGHLTYKTFASGGSFSKFSHEFQALTPAGEDTIYIDREKNIAINKEVYNDEVLAELGLKKEELVEDRAVEVGNIFPLGTKFSEPLGLTYLDEKGEKQLVVMGSYGIGIGRLMGTVVEVLSDDNGIVWPEEIAPFSVHIISLGKKDEESFKMAEKLYNELQSKGVEVLFDDRETGVGAKFADADLIGVPTRVVASSRSLDAGGLEVQKRNEENSQTMTVEEFLNSLN